MGQPDKEKKMAELNWIITSQNNSVTPVIPAGTHTLDLVNTTVHEAIVYGERRYGINLVWGDPGKSDNIRFQRSSGSKGPLKFGELIAINVRRGGFLVYHKRNFGIRLVWRDEPSFEWKIAGGKEGEIVNTGKVVALFNTVEKDFLFYDPREYGINLKWQKDKGKFNKSLFESVADKAVDIGKDAAMETVGGKVLKTAKKAGLGSVAGKALKTAQKAGLGSVAGKALKTAQKAGAAAAKKAGV
jgi:hypothetical protein